VMFLGVLMLGSLGAFLLYVPVLPLIVVVAILLSSFVMFILGVHTGGRRIRISRMKNPGRPRVARWNSLTRVG
jgi:hypothetical protein